MNLIAKPIVKGQLWVVTDGQQKVGNVELKNNGYSVKIGKNESYFDSTKSIEDFVAISFEHYRNKVVKNKPPYAIWPTTGRTYNNLFDVKRKLHVYTKSKKSKCYYVAGWFQVKMNEGWQTIFCPKYIFIQRYEYVGPFLSQNEASNR